MVNSRPRRPSRSGISVSQTQRRTISATPAAPTMRSRVTPVVKSVVPTSSFTSTTVPGSRLPARTGSPAIFSPRRPMVRPGERRSNFPAAERAHGTLLAILPAWAPGSTARALRRGKHRVPRGAHNRATGDGTVCPRSAAGVALVGWLVSPGHDFSASVASGCCPWSSMAPARTPSVRTDSLRLRPVLDCALGQ